MGGIVPRSRASAGHGPASRWNMVGMLVRTDRRFDLPVPPAALWVHLAQVERYPQWWPWLRRFDGRALAAEEEWACTVQPPLPYSVSFTVHLDRVEAPVRAAAHVHGDIEGWAELSVEPASDGSQVRLVSALAPSNGHLRLATRLAGPVVRFGHDWVVGTAVRQFAARAL